MVDNGEFREDLFYRLNVVTIHSPPLRDRKDDIDQLAERFLQDAAEEHSLGSRTLSPEAMKQLIDYHWPGNIRELKNLIEREVILSEDQEITSVTLRSSSGRPKAGVTSSTHQSSSPQTEATEPESTGKDDGVYRFSSEVVPWQELHQAIGKGYIKHVLRRCNGNVSEAARTLCLERAYLHRLMKKLGIQRGVVVSD